MAGEEARNMLFSCKNLNISVKDCTNHTKEIPHYGKVQRAAQTGGMLCYSLVCGQTAMYIWWCEFRNGSSLLLLYRMSEMLHYLLGNYNTGQRCHGKIKDFFEKSFSRWMRNRHSLMGIYSTKNNNKKSANPNLPRTQSCLLMICHSNRY